MILSSTVWLDEVGALQRRIVQLEQENQAMQQRQALLEGILDNVNISIFAKEYASTDGTYIFANRQFAALCNVKPHEICHKICHKKDADLFPEAIAAALRQTDQAVLAGGQLVELEEVVPQADGRLHTSLVIKFPLCAADGTPTIVCGVAADITPRKQAEVALQKLNTELEHKVQTRTAELQDTITQLEAQVQQSQRLLAERTVVETALQQTQAFLTSVIHAMPVAVFVKDAASLRYRLWNAAAESLVGFPAEDILGKTDADLFSPAQADFFTQRDRQVLAQGQPLEIPEETLHTQQGQTRILRIKKVPIGGSEFPAQRPPQYLLAVWEDITERKRSEALLKQQLQLSDLRSQIDSALTRSHHSLQDMLQCCSDAIVQHLDAAFARIWTLNRQDDVLELQSSSGMYTHIDGPHARVPVGQFKIGLIAAERQPHLTNAVLTDPRIGNPEWAKQEGMVAFAGYPLLVGDQLLGVVALFARQALSRSILDALAFISHEIALGIQRKHAELALQTSEAQLRQQTQFLQRTVRDLQQTQSQLIQSEKMSGLGQLVAGVAHEINNPVNFIYGNLRHAKRYSEELLDLVKLYQVHYPQPLSAIQTYQDAIDLDFLKTDLAQLLQSMQVGADRIREIVLSLRLFSRLDESDYKAANIHDGLDSTLMILQHRLKAKPEQPPIRIIKEYGDLPWVECYAGQLNQVFMNVLVNAIDALESHSLINTTAPTIHIHTALAAPNLIQIQIRDNGPGIPLEIQPRLFDPFFTTKPVGMGTGMGLSISYQIVTDRHQGSLCFQSQSGHGTTFTIKIPLSQRQRLAG